jgi:hypothetical protein
VTGARRAAAWWSLVLGGLTAARRRRATHGAGVTLAGRFVADPDPALPDPDRLGLGRESAALVRYADVLGDDDAGNDGRSAAVRVGLPGGDLDLTLHTGRANLFWDAPSWAEFTRATSGGEAGMRAYLARHPHLREVAAEALRRAPDSFHGLVYHQPVAVRLRARDGRRWLVRFRLHAPDAADSGLLVGADREGPWRLARAPGERRQPHYLREELVVRLGRGPTRQVLSVALRPDPGTPWARDCDASVPWDEPFLQLGTVECDRALDPVAAARIGFRPAELPPPFERPESTSVHDLHSLLALRARVYPVAQRVRSLVGVTEVRATHVATGTLVHDDLEAAPLHHVHVELWSAFRHRLHQRLAAGVTDADGRFRLHHPGTGHAHDDLVLRVFEPHASARVDGQPGDSLVERARVPAFLDGPPRAFEFGTCRVAYWEYDPVLPIPRARTEGGAPQERFAPGVRRRLAAQNAARFAVRAVHRACSRHPRTEPSLERIQRGYPESLVARVEREQPGCTDTDAFLADRLLNGFSPMIPLRDDDGALRLSVRFDEVESDGHMELVSGDARFTLDADGRLAPRSIDLDVRDASHTAPFSPTRRLTATPADGPRWRAARRAFRSAWGLSGVLDTHLAHGHLNVEQYAVALFRNVRRSPLRRLLGPHLREVSAINHFGQGAVFGASGIVTNNSPLTSASALARLAAGVGRCDWSTFRPRAPLSEHHRYARAANLFWDLVERHVARFFAEEASGLAEEWLEVHRFSRDLVARSARFAPVPERERYTCHRELDDPRLPRETVGGVLRAVRPVTRADRPADGDLQRLAQLCRYVIFHATFFHTWENDLQAEDGGDVAYATLGVPAGAIELDDERTLRPSPRQATDQLYYAHGLASRTPGMLVANDRGDVPGPLPALVAAHRAEFALLGVDVDTLRSRINV